MPRQKAISERAAGADEITRIELVVHISQTQRIDRMAQAADDQAEQGETPEARREDGDGEARRAPSRLRSAASIESRPIRSATAPTTGMGDGRADQHRRDEEGDLGL